MNPAYILVCNFPGETQLSLKIVLHRGIGGNLWFQNFQGDDFVSFQVASFIDHARAARADL